MSVTVDGFTDVEMLAFKSLMFFFHVQFSQIDYVLLIIMHVTLQMCSNPKPKTPVSGL